ncbi:DUF6795 domain-containing protein [Shewanella frigidimarina]|uniref:DUF6795 domain-containing protein n=1 Tax=Shewanella frigidimarina TaxID=56812 RepID=UPI000F50E802|nr:DUF6795 domain-containing protein [Shewanella frigidimarina]RPA38607.1 hypothetical protein EGC78_02175 [Shewanella frigidimarina]
MSFSETLRKLSNHLGTHKVHLCPKVRGQLVNKGKPLNNVKIMRTLSYSDGKYTEDIIYTDVNGNFQFPEKSLRSSQPALLIAEKIVYQLITAHFDGREFKLWLSNPSGIEPIEEYANKLKLLNGDIADDEIFFSFIDNKHPHPYKATSICRWDDDFKEIIIDDDPFRFVNQD